jgi:hypothetical protein
MVQSDEPFLSKRVTIDRNVGERLRNAPGYFASEDF